MMAQRMWLLTGALWFAGWPTGCERPLPPVVRRQSAVSALPVATPLIRAQNEAAPFNQSPPQPAAFVPRQDLAQNSLFDGSELDTLMAEAIAAHKLPGGVIAIGRSTGVLLTRAYGKRALVPTPEPIAVDTIFDLASLTKPVATASAIMLLAQDGKLRVDDVASRYLPLLKRPATRSITLRQLLVHGAGLPHINPLRDYAGGPKAAIQAILGASPSAPPNRFLYSDLGYLWLGEVVQSVAGQNLDEFTRERIFAPLGMLDTRFQPSEHLLARIAPTEITDDRGTPGMLIRGVVHDPRAYRLGGIGGNAGLFSTAGDLSRFARMLLLGGELDGTRVFSEQNVADMTRPVTVGSDVRTLGWDMHSEYSRLRGHLLSERAFGHGGFTGTSLWIDPGQDLFVLLLSNRVHPDGQGNVIGLAGALADAAVRALQRLDPCTAPKAQIAPGIDVLREQGFAPLLGKRIGLVTHLAARSTDDQSTLDVLLHAHGVQLAAVFSPEHGLAGAREGAIKDDNDARRGLRIYSLFGETRRPTTEMLEGIDLLVVDLVDVGTRFFTYMSTLHQVLLAAAEHHLPVMLLDRPNPLGGAVVEGPVLDAARRSFVNFYALPIRHGLTAGELASLINAEEHLGVALQVIDVRGWHRELLASDTGLRWTRPSPNLKSAQAALLYPAVGLLESTNLSVGRGTDNPFEQFGAPFIDSRALLDALSRVQLAGVRFGRVEFVPKQGPHARTRCFGLKLTVLDPVAFQPVRTGIEIARAMHKLCPTQWEAEKLDKLLGHAESLKALLEGAQTDAIESLWAPELARFRQRRQPHLHYPSCERR